MDYNENIQERIERLLASGEWSAEDKRWLLQYLQTTEHAELRHLMEKQFHENKTVLLSATDADRLLKSIHTKTEADQRATVTGIFRNKRYLSIAASVIIVLSLVVVFLQRNSTAHRNNAVAVTPVQKNDRQPGKDNALLTLADGSVIVLEDAANGTIATQGTSTVKKINGQITYDNASSANGEVLYNTIATAKGNQYQLTLADGSKVWLNAASSLRFPAAFTGNERRVEITGEAYFEVAKNASKPFIVTYTTQNREKGEVHVLGTHFNVNSYADEAEVKTTLVEGKVKVQQADASVLLIPQQAAVFNKAGKQLVVRPADTDEAIAWKSGMFEFNDTALPEIMRQLSRWYDVDVVFESNPSSKQYNGSIRRQATLQQVLEILKLSGVSCSLTGKRLTVKAT